MENELDYQVSIFCFTVELGRLSDSKISMCRHTCGGKQTNPVLFPVFEMLQHCIKSKRIRFGNCEISIKLPMNGKTNEDEINLRDIVKANKREKKATR